MAFMMLVTVLYNVFLPCVLYSPPPPQPVVVEQPTEPVIEPEPVVEPEIDYSKLDPRSAKDAMITIVELQSKDYWDDPKSFAVVSEGEIKVDGASVYERIIVDTISSEVVLVRVVAAKDWKEARDIFYGVAYALQNPEDEEDKVIWDRYNWGDRDDGWIGETDDGNFEVVLFRVDNLVAVLIGKDYSLMTSVAAWQQDRFKAIVRD